MKKSIITCFVALAASLSTFSQEKRPQEPTEPYPYISENVTINGQGGILTLPAKGKNFPAVVLLSGSGPQDRNSALAGHKPFLVLADHLTRNGIAVLRLDDRGVGETKGIYNETGVKELKADAEDALRYLKARKEVNKAKTGLVGHSLGGVVAQAAAAGSKDIGFIVLLAAPGMRGDKLMLRQKEIMERKVGASDEEIALGQQQMTGVYDLIVRSGDDVAALKAELKTYFGKIYGAALQQNQLEMITSQLSYPWFSGFIKHDPVDFLDKVKCPVLALNGAKDLQVPPENLKAIEDALKAGGNNNVKVVEMEGLNHLFQQSETGLSNEYAKITQTFSPDAMKIIADWVNKL